MVTRQCIEMWSCPHCSAEFDNEDVCNDHIEDAHCEIGIYKTKNVYKCDVCNEKYDKYNEALDCETAHKEGNDMQYQAFLDQQEMDKLVEAGNHPSQKKLVL